MSHIQNCSKQFCISFSLDPPYGILCPGHRCLASTRCLESLGGRSQLLPENSLLCGGGDKSPHKLIFIAGPSGKGRPSMVAGPNLLSRQTGARHEQGDRQTEGQRPGRSDKDAAPTFLYFHVYPPLLRPPEMKSLNLDEIGQGRGMLHFCPVPQR